MPASPRRCTKGIAKPAIPSNVTHSLEPELLARPLPAVFPESMPALAKLVVASPFDAALHDAFGKLLGLNCYRTYGPEFLEHDLGHYLGAEFAGERLSDYVLTEPKPRMPLYHLVGALDPLTPQDVVARSATGCPNTSPSGSGATASPTSRSSSTATTWPGTSPARSA